MQLSRNDVQVGSIIKTDCQTVFRVTNPDHADGAMCVRQLKTTGGWTKKENAFKYGNYPQITSITK